MLTKKVLHKLEACFLAGLGIGLAPLNEKTAVIMLIGAVLLGCWLAYRE